MTPQYSGRFVMLRATAQFQNEGIVISYENKDCQNCRFVVKFTSIAARVILLD